MVTNVAEQNSDLRNWKTSFPKMFASFVLAATILGCVSETWGQGNGFSRWSSSNPPTPSQVAQPVAPADELPRRLPPVEEEVTTGPQASSFANPGKTRVAARPQSHRSAADTAKPVNWSNPSIVIGPETRQVSHEEAIPSARTPSHDSAATISSGSRFTQSSVAPVDTDIVPTPKSGKSIFARVFDETEELPNQPTAEAETATSPDSDVEPESADDELSPIFACRLLGLRTTKAEKASKN